MESIQKKKIMDIALNNFRLMSRTANGKIDVSASVTKKDVIEAVDGKTAARLAEENYRKAMAFEMKECMRGFDSVEELRAFMEKIAGMINHGIVKKGSLIRSGADSVKWNYTRIVNLEREMQWFYQRLFERLTADVYDPVETAAFTEYYMNLKIHMWADGCCKTSMAASAYMMMRGGLLPVHYRSREEYYHAVLIDTLNACGSEEDLAKYKVFNGYYHSLLPVQLADIFAKMRRVSIDGCKMIGSGMNGKVYRLDEETIVKVYSKKNSIQAVLQEKEFAKWALIHDIPTAISFAVVRVGNQYGMVFELLEAMSVSQLILQNPDRTELYMKQYVDFMKKIHSVMADTLIMKDRKKEYIDMVYDISDMIGEALTARILKPLSDIPDDVTLLHGDFHLDNVLQTKWGFMVIDMDMLGFGNPIFDFVNLYSTLIGFRIIDPDNFVVKVPKAMNHKLWGMTLHLYYSEMDEHELHKMNNLIAALSMVRVLGYCRKKEYPVEIIKQIKQEFEYRLENI